MFRPFGAHVELVADDHRVTDACCVAVCRYPVDAGAVGRYRITATTTADTGSDPDWPRTSIRQFEGGIELRCGSGCLQVDHRNRTASVTIPPALLAVPDAVRMLVEGAVSSLLIGAGELHAVHSGLVVASGHGLMLRGPSGAGKSTLTYACMQAGFAMASDDWIYGTAVHRPEIMYGYPWRMFLVPDALAHFPELAGQAPVAHPGADRLKLEIIPAVARRRVSARVDCIVFLDPATELELRPVRADEALERFWGPALPSERADLPSGWVDALLDRPCFVLQRGTLPAAAAGLLQRLASSLR